MDILTSNFNSIVFFTLLLLIVRGLWSFSKQKSDLEQSVRKDVHTLFYNDGVRARRPLQSENLNHSKTDQNIKEKRKSTRYCFDSFVELIKDGMLFKVISRDLSDTGIFLKTRMHKRLQVNDRVMLTFQSYQGTPQKRFGQVVRKDVNGIGIRFQS